MRELWDQSNQYGRRIILKAARRDSIHQFRAWDHVPEDVQEDVIKNYYQSYAYRCATKGE